MMAMTAYFHSSGIYESVVYVPGETDMLWRGEEISSLKRKPCIILRAEVNLDDMLKKGTAKPALFPLKENCSPKP